MQLLHKTGSRSGHAQGYTSLIIHSSAGHFWGRRAGHGIPDLKTRPKNYFDLPLRCLARRQRIRNSVLCSDKNEVKDQLLSGKPAASTAYPSREIPCALQDRENTEPLPPNKRDIRYISACLLKLLWIGN